VIVGAGIDGALIAQRLTQAGLRVQLFEAGPDTAQRSGDCQAHLQRFYAAAAKGEESPWPPATAARQPDGADLQHPGGYFVQRGPQPYGSTYTRRRDGSTLHWLGVSLRMLREDFRMRTQHGVARGWPFRYEDLEPYYGRAEQTIGVSADVADQAYLGVHFPEGYDYPMHSVPLSWSARRLAAAVNGMRVTLGGEERALKIRSYPEARNAMPRGSYRP
jgi:choline dehydrogenase-like flavoprotein